MSAFLPRRLRTSFQHASPEVTMPLRVFAHVANTQLSALPGRAERILDQKRTVVRAWNDQHGVSGRILARAGSSWIFVHCRDHVDCKKSWRHRISNDTRTVEEQGVHADKVATVRGSTRVQRQRAADLAALPPGRAMTAAILDDNDDDAADAELPFVVAVRAPRRKFLCLVLRVYCFCLTCCLDGS